MDKKSFLNSTLGIFMKTLFKLFCGSKIRENKC